MTKAAFAATPSAPQAKPNAGRPIDICVFGCTGNAGRAVAFHAVRCAQLGSSDKQLTIGLAGRSRSKVQSVWMGYWRNCRSNRLMFRARLWWRM